MADEPDDSGLGPQKQDDIPDDQIDSGNDFVPKSDPLSAVPAPGANVDTGGDENDNRDDDDRDDDDRDDE
jgi:hypothetical protein